MRTNILSRNLSIEFRKIRKHYCDKFRIFTHMSNAKKNTAYLTKRTLVRKSKKAIQEASEKAMETIGYIIVARDGWIVKEYQDGTIEQIEELETANGNQELILD
ncbi:MAG: hypothetical protein HN778_21085 [Prolixibacteraceae bacterium]|jgi:hypothetical protein|nr:hypothetical protein [Prolixibacteraceae bacterium]MBT4969232.1 hypothetical protein [Bacteroidota bacterium]MBT6007618.1 hypothetical protein [Prolixibacteraceae bacterium]MBT6764303.1 hypothetical protein [Prolixibacteraceae bacterium]MBT7000863.1 hypothetical protein [Prolixibacteraceae bacterium]